MRSRINQIVRPLTGAFRNIAADDRTQNLACAIALPFAFKAVSTGNPWLAGVGAVTLLGCGIELGVDDPSFIGPIIENIPEALKGG